MIFNFLTHLQYYIVKTCCGESATCGESTLPPPMWPGFDFWTQRHMWAVGSRPCSEGFSLATLVFLPQQKPTRSLFEPAVGCVPRSCMDHTVAARRCLYMLSVRPARAVSLLYFARVFRETVIGQLFYLICFLLRLGISHAASSSQSALFWLPPESLLARFLKNPER